jgi:nitrite reductase (NADH) large subunit
LATDIDAATCIKYLDRFLMFYVKTADPLTRTATWLNKMEGGIAYLKSVVIDDALGMNAQWEADMERHVATYECEWKAAIETPELRKRFNHFVNAPAEKDPTAEVVPMREMVKAKDWK